MRASRSRLVSLNAQAVPPVLCQVLPGLLVHPLNVRHAALTLFRLLRPQLAKRGGPTQSATVLFAKHDIPVSTEWSASVFPQTQDGPYTVRVLLATRATESEWHKKQAPLYGT